MSQDENLFTPGKKPRMLVIERDSVTLAVIEQVAEDFGFKILLAKDSAEAIRLIELKFCQLIICNPRLIHGSSINFIGNIRSRRGYEKTPVIMITDDVNPQKNSTFLEEGADGYINKPLTREMLFAHLNLFMRRQIYESFSREEFRKRGLSNEQGCVILCSSDAQILDIPLNAMDVPVIVVTTEEQLFRTLFSSNVWIVLIGTDAKWALPLVGKIKNEESLNLQVILLRNSNVLDSEVVDFFNNGGDDITSVKKPAFILSRQLNSRIEREAYYKNKYISALREAAAQLPIRSENEMTRSWNHWSFHALHHTHEEIPGGDFYEVVELNNDEYMLVLGDVMGKKWGAWFFSLAYLAYIRSTVRNIAGKEKISPALFLEELNQAIFRDFKLSEVFTTLTLVMFNEKTSHVSIASAAGLPLFIKYGEKNEVAQVQAKGSLLGFDENATFEEVNIDLAPGDSIILVTDGFSEINNHTGIQLLTGYLNTKDADLRPSAIDAFVRNSLLLPFSDDRTLLILSRD